MVSVSRRNRRLSLSASKKINGRPVVWHGFRGGVQSGGGVTPFSVSCRKADEGAEKSCCSKRRRKRGLRKGHRRSRVGKTRRSDPDRPTIPHTDRKARREGREYSWSLARSEWFVNKIQLGKSMYSEYSHYLDHWLRQSYKGFTRVVSRVSSLGTPITFYAFFSQVDDNNPWIGEPDVCLRCKLIDDLEHSLLGTNVTFGGEFVPYRGGVTIGSLRKKTLSFLCTRCGRRTRGDRCSVCDTKRSPSSSTKGRGRGARRAR
jgi:hypothetical protein